MNNLQLESKWTKYSENQTKEKTRFLQLLNLLVNSYEIPEKPYVYGRPSLLVSDIIKCCCIKVYTTLSCRRVIPELKEAYEAGIITKVPGYNMLNGYMRKKWFSKLIKEIIEYSALPFIETDHNFAVDATGFGNLIYTPWLDVRTQKASKKKGFLKVNLICSTDSFIIPTAIVTEGKAFESPGFKELINTTSRNFEIKEIYADKAYSSRENYELVKRKGGQAYIDFRKNSSGKTPGSMEWRKAFKMWKYNSEEFYKKYSKRSHIESLFSSIKRTKMGTIRSKDFNASKSEILLKILCHNLVILSRQN